MKKLIQNNTLAHTFNIKVKLPETKVEVKLEEWEKKFNEHSPQHITYNIVGDK